MRFSLAVRNKTVGPALNKRLRSRRRPQQLVTDDHLTVERGNSASALADRGSWPAAAVWTPAMSPTRRHQWARRPPPRAHTLPTYTPAATAAAAGRSAVAGVTVSAASPACSATSALRTTGEPPRVVIAAKTPTGT